MRGGEVLGQGQQAGPAIRGGKAPILEQSGTAPRPVGVDGPAQGFQHLELGAAQTRQPRDIKLAGPVVLEAGEGGVLAEDLVLVLIGEPLAKAESAGELGQRPPVWPGLPRQGQKGALSTDGALGVGDGAALLPPGGGCLLYTSPSPRD